MVILLFEGIDNLGKSTMVNMFSEHFCSEYNILTMHSRAPRELNGVTPFEYQKTEFVSKAKMLREMYRFEDPECTGHKLLPCMALLDRSWLDEYVYGQIYRGEDKNAVMDLIDRCFKIFSCTDIKVCIVSLEGSEEFAYRHDDKKSFTSNLQKDDAVKMIRREKLLFDEVIAKCVERGYAKCVSVKVNEDEFLFRSKEAIFSNLVKGLKEKGLI